MSPYSTQDLHVNIAHNVHVSIYRIM